MGKGYLLGELHDLGQSRCWPRVKNQQGSPQPPPTAYAGTHLLTSGLGRMGVTLHSQGTSTVKASSEGQVLPGSIYPELKKQANRSHRWSPVRATRPESLKDQTLIEGCSGVEGARGVSPLLERCQQEQASELADAGSWAVLCYLI